MENDKPSYEEIEKELNDYKELLWQLSDEYRINLGNAEKKIEELQAKLKSPETIAIEGQAEDASDFLSKLGLPACIFDNEGKLLRHNNKFKFLVELLSFEIEEITSITVLFEKNRLDNLTEKFNTYLKDEGGLLQSLFRIENAFKNLVNLVVRIYHLTEENNHLAIFVELNKTEIDNLIPEKPKNLSSDILSEQLQKIEIDPEFNELKTEIAIFSDKYELFEDLLKLPEFSTDNNEISRSILNSIKRSFQLENIRNKILDKLNTRYKAFITHINVTYPDLTSNEEKHCMLIKAGLTYKEIAAIMGVSINGVKIARNRLRKKFDLENDTKTSAFIDKI